MCSAEVLQISDQSMSVCTELGRLPSVQEPAASWKPRDICSTLCPGAPQSKTVQHPVQCSHQLCLTFCWVFTSLFSDINERPASYTAHTTTEVLRSKEKEVNSERFNVPFAWLETVLLHKQQGQRAGTTCYLSRMKLIFTRWGFCSICFKLITF